MDYTIQKNLLQGLQNGETAAFEHLQEKSYRLVAFIVEKTGGSEEDAEDIYAEGIVVLLKNINKPNFVMNSMIQTYLVDICKNMNKDRLKSENSGKNFLNEQRDGSYEENFEALIDHKVFQGIFWKSFKKLKDDCQTLLKKVLDKVPQKIIAQEMGLSLGSIKNKKKNCLIALTNIINAHPDYAKMVQNNEITFD